MDFIFNEKYASFINAAIIIILIIFLNKFVRQLLKKQINKDSNKHQKTILIFTRNTITYIIYSIGILIALSQFSAFSTFSITILSALGVLAAVIGLALQESLKNIFGSFEIIVNRPFGVGDYIKLSEKNIAGTVEEVSLRHTIIRTANNQRQIVPNSLLNTLILENANFRDNEICLHEEYAISYTSDIDKAISILKEEIENICIIKFSKYNKDVEFPKVRVTKWENSCIKLRAYVWGQDLGQAYENLFELNKKLKERYDNEGIEIPYDYINVVSKK